MSKGDFPAIRMRIEGGRLIPAGPYEQERIDSFRKGTVVMCRFTEERDRVLLKKWWAILGLVVKQCPVPWKTKEEASEAVKLALGIVNLTKTVKGDFLAYPKSLTDLEDPELQDAVEQMTELLSRITGVDVETLKKETAHIQPEPDKPHDPATGEILPSADASPQAPADHGDATESSPSVTSSEPAGVSPVSAPAGFDAPDMFGKFNFDPKELVDLQDLARKALDDAAGDNDLPAKEAAIAKLFDSYFDAIETADGRAAMTAMEMPISYVVKGARPRAKASDFIARDILGVKPEALERRK